MLYISMGKWRDLSDGHLYHEGDKFPFDGREIENQRLTNLLTNGNRAGFPLIKEQTADSDLEMPIKEQKRQKKAVNAPETASKASDEQEPIQKKEAPRRANKARKTAKK